MAEEHNAIKYGTALSKAISTAVGGGYGDVGVSRVSETLSPQIDPWARPEWSLLRGEILFARALTSPAVAARFAGIQMLNAPGSSKLVVVTRISRYGGTPGIIIGVDTASTVSLANPVTNRGVSCDTRFPSIGQTSTCQLIVGDGATTVALPQVQLTAGDFSTTQPFVIAPGSSLFLLSDTVNAAIFANISFSERTPFPGELQARG